MLTSVLHPDLLETCLHFATVLYFTRQVQFFPDSMELHTRVLDNGVLLSLELALATAVIEAMVMRCRGWATQDGIHQKISIDCCSQLDIPWKGSPGNSRKSR